MTLDLTIIVAAWNASATIERCIESALAQTGVDLEVIVADDCSSDATCDIVAAIAQKDKRVRLLVGTENGGPAAARNRALAESCGNWVAVLDADDKVLPGRAAGLQKFADARGADIVFDNIVLVDERGAEDTNRKRFLDTPEFGYQQCWTLQDYIQGNSGSFSQASLGYLKPTLRRSFLQSHRIRYDETLRNSEDYHLIAECLAQGAVVWFHPEAHYEYTVAAGSISHRVPTSYLDALLDAEDRFMERHRGTLSGDVLKLLRSRKAQIANLRTTEAALGALKGGKLGGALREIGQNPASLARISRHLGEAVAKRLQRS